MASDKIYIAGHQKSYDPYPDAGACEFPSDLIDPKIKETKEYCLKYAKAIYYRFKNNLMYVNASRRHDWIENRMYAVGNQPISKYVGYISRLKDKGRNISYLNLDWSTIKIIPKFRDVVLSYLEKIDYEIYCDAINPEARKAKESTKWRIWAEKLLAPFFMQLAKEGNIPKMGDVSGMMPETLQELDMMMQYSFRLQEEMMMEMGIQVVQNENNWKELLRLIREDAFDLGVMSVKVYVDRISNRIKIDYVDPINMVLEDFRGHDGSKMQRIGEIRRMTIAQLRLEAGDQFTEEQYMDIARASVGKYGNNDLLHEDYINTDDQFYRRESMRNYDNNYIYVLDIDWDSVDKKKYERNNKYGNEMIYEKPFNTNEGKHQVYDEQGNILYEKEVFSVYVKTVYTCKWIIGTDYCYDYGRLHWIPRPLENLRECYKRYKFYRISPVSHLERMIYFADSIQLTAYKIQNLKARAMPKGIFIELGALDNILLDGKPMKASEIIEIGFQSGIWVYRDTNSVDDYGGTKRKPIEETEGGMGREFMELINSMAQDIEMLRQVSGINEFMDASTPPDTLVGIGQIGLASAQNAVHPLLNGIVKIHEQSVSHIVLLMQLLARYKDIRGYIPAIGAGAKLFEITSSVSQTEYYTPVIYGVRIEARDTQTLKSAIIRAADAALASSQDPSKGGIEIHDHTEIMRMIESGVNLKLVSAVLAYRMKKYKENQQLRDLEKIRAQSEEIQKQTQLSKEAEMNMLIAKANIEKELYTHKINEDIRKMTVEMELRGRNDAMKVRIQKE